MVISDLPAEALAKAGPKKESDLPAGKAGILPDDAEVWRDLFEDANDLIQSVDKDGKFLYVNKKWRDLLGYSYEEVRKMAFPNIIHPKHLQACLTAFGEMQQGKSFDNFTTQFVTKDGRIVNVEGNISVRMKDGEFVSTWGIFRDVTFRNQREQELDHIAKMLVRRDFELLQTNDILRIRDEQIVKEHELNRAKSEFVSLTSHQLKTPLTIIKWYIEMLGAGYAGNSAKKQKEYLEKIYNNTQRMVELIDAFLNVSRLELGVFSIKNEPLNLKNKMESILRDFAPKLKEKKLKLSQAYTKSNFAFSADAKMIQIIFENLISNAVKYTSRGGTIRVKMQKKGNEISIGVEDTGIGIPTEQQSKIFTKFFRADNASSYKADGTGLGLYIVKTMVEKIGGKIWFKSTENKGTIFYVAIPLKLKPVVRGS